MSEVGGGAVGLITGCYVLFIWAYNWAVWGKATYKCGGGGESTSRMTVLFTITEKKQT